MGFNSSLITLMLAIIIVGVLIFLAIRFSTHRAHTFDTEEYQTRWLKIKNSVNKDNPYSLNHAVVEADKLLDKAMHEMGISGNTMGERLKHAGNKFSSLNAIWNAHKLRNAIAHEPDFQLEYRQTLHALNVFSQALKDLGAI